VNVEVILEASGNLLWSPVLLQRDRRPVCCADDLIN